MGMNLENIILSKSDKDKYYDITCMWNQKNNTKESTYKTETEQTHKQKTNLWLPKGEGVGEDKLGV